MPIAMKRKVARKRVPNKASLTSRWPLLSEDDVNVIVSDAAQLVARLQEKYGLTVEDAQRQANEFMRGPDDRIVAAYNDAAEAVEAAADRVDQLVKENTWTAVIAALLVGGLVGYSIRPDRGSRYLPGRGRRYW